jgi:hypothetical protein
MDSNKVIADIVSKAQDFIGVTHNIPDTIYTSAINIVTRNTEIPAHFDYLDPELLKTKKIVRINIHIQNAKVGGLLCTEKNNIINELIIPERALMTFDASDIKHWVSKNYSGVPRYTLSIVAVVDR